MTSSARVSWTSESGGQGRNLDWDANLSHQLRDDISKNPVGIATYGGKSHTSTVAGYLKYYLMCFPLAIPFPTFQVSVRALNTPGLQRGILMLGIRVQEESNEGSD